MDGRSLTPLLFPRGSAAPAGWPQGVLVEHQGSVGVDAGPDRPARLSGNPPSYVALRLPRALYVQYKDGEHEYYDLRSDPSEIHNIYSSLPAARVSALHREVATLEACHNRPACSMVHPVA